MKSSEAGGVITSVNSIYPSMRVLLTGDLTNHKSDSAILSDKQIRGESRLKLVFFLFKKWHYKG